MCVYIYIYIYNNNEYSALGPVWQEPEPSPATSMAPICCILGKFLGVVCHCFPPIYTYLHPPKFKLTASVKNSHINTTNYLL